MTDSVVMLETVVARLNPAHSAVLVIDMQNDFCAVDGYVEKVVGRDATACRNVVSPVKALVADARARSVPIVWVAAHYDADRIPHSMRTKQLERSAAVCCATGSWGAEFYGLAPAEGDHIFHKHSYSAFIGTSLAQHLNASGIRTLVFAGVQTNVCVENSVRDAFCLGFYCVVAEDCVASHAPHLHDATLANIKFLYGDVVARDDVTKHWDSHAMHQTKAQAFP